MNLNLFLRKLIIKIKVYFEVMHRFPKKNVFYCIYTIGLKKTVSFIKDRLQNRLLSLKLVSKNQNRFQFLWSIRKNRNKFLFFQTGFKIKTCFHFWKRYCFMNPNSEIPYKRPILIIKIVWNWIPRKILSRIPMIYL